MNSKEVNALEKAQSLKIIIDKVRKTNIDGCDEISEEDLRLKIRMIPGQVYSKSQLERDRQAMIDYYHSEGYLLAEVGYRETATDENKNQENT